MKTLVYTAIFGGKDNAPKLINREEVNLSDYRFICVTDNPDLKSEDYEVILQKPEFSDITKNARKIKINGYGDMSQYHTAIWHDSSVHLHCDKLKTLSVFAETTSITVFHHVRYCAYLEAIACINQNKDSAVRMTWQMWRYFKEGFPSKNKLHETTIMALNCSSFFGSELQKLWWTEIVNGSRRDQLSLAYASWKTSTDIGLLAHWTASGSNNEFSTWIGHQHGRYHHKNVLLLLNFKPIRIICKKLLYEMRRRR